MTTRRIIECDQCSRTVELGYGVTMPPGWSSHNLGGHADDLCLACTAARMGWRNPVIAGTRQRLHDAVRVRAVADVTGAGL